MNTKKTTLGSLTVLALLLMLTPAQTGARERHPEIRAALDSLQTARTDLQQARHDYHGHRAAALHHVDEAIHEAQTCMQE